MAPYQPQNDDDPVIELIEGNRRRMNYLGKIAEDGISMLSGIEMPIFDDKIRLNKIKQKIFTKYPEIERKILHKKINFTFKGKTLGDNPDLSMKVLSEDKNRFKHFLEELNKVIVELDESSNYSVIEYIHEPLFDIGRNIERKLTLFRQMSSKRELQKMFK